MKCSRGFVSTPWMIYLAIGAAVMAALWYAYTTIDGRGHARGVAETTAKYAERDNQALQAALARVKALQDEKAAAERAHEKRLAVIAADHKKEISNANAQRDHDVAAVRAGYRLHDPSGAGRTAQCPRSAGAASAAAAGQRDGGAAGELSEEATGFLLGLVNDADDVARQLHAAQQVIVEQIRTCNGP